MTMEPNQPDQPDQPEPELPAEARPAAATPSPGRRRSAEPAARRQPTRRSSPRAAPVGLPACVAAPRAPLRLRRRPSRRPRRLRRPRRRRPPRRPGSHRPYPPDPSRASRFADHGPRLISFILDHLIILGISLLILVGVPDRGRDLRRRSASTSWRPRPCIARVIGFFVVYFIYFPYFWTKTGQTLGMRPFTAPGRDGQGRWQGHLGPAILRLIGYWIDQIVFYLGYIWVLIDSRRRGWHDLIAGHGRHPGGLAPHRRGRLVLEGASAVARGSGAASAVGDDEQQHGEDERGGDDEQEPPADLEQGDGVAPSRLGR